jgi:hypothetical protein
MIKRVGIFQLAEGKDPDEAWKIYTEVHAPDVVSITPGLRRYVVSRAVEPWIEKSGQMGGKPRWWGLLEQWYDNEETFNHARSVIFNPATPKTESQRRNDELWFSYYGERLGEAIVEERVIIKNPVPENHCKRLGIFGLTEGADPEEAWKYWVGINAVNWKDTMPGCSLFAISRVAKVPEGSPTPKWWGLMEQRFDSREACERAMETPRPADEFVSRFIGDLTGVFAYVEEKVII